MTIAIVIISLITAFIGMLIFDKITDILFNREVAKREAAQKVAYNKALAHHNQSIEQWKLSNMDW